MTSEASSAESDPSRVGFDPGLKLPEIHQVNAPTPGYLIMNNAATL